LCNECVFDVNEVEQADACTSKVVVCVAELSLEHKAVLFFTGNKRFEILKQVQINPMSLVKLSHHLQYSAHPLDGHLFRQNRLLWMFGVVKLFLRNLLAIFGELVKLPFCFLALGGPYVQIEVTVKLLHSNQFS
jgi:hypothetical protein